MLSALKAAGVNLRTGEGSATMGAFAGVHTQVALAGMGGGADRPESQEASRAITQEAVETLLAGRQQVQAAARAELGDQA